MTLRILSYTILAGGENRLPLIANVIQKQQPDVVALQEARSRSNAEALAHQLGMGFTFGEAHNTNKDHVVWLSRLPVIHTENHPLPILAKTLLEIEVLWKGMPLSLLRFSYANVCKHPSTQNVVVAASSVGASRPKPLGLSPRPQPS
jgi:endonuclease/exonuclease/phosphatase family metal-dependent hydrolase